MNERNKSTLLECVNRIIDNEYDGITAAKKSLEEKNKLLTETLNLLKIELKKEQSKFNEYKKYQLFYYTHFSACPQCDGAGGWEDGDGGGGQCDICFGKGELKMEEIQEFLKPKCAK